MQNLLDELLQLCKQDQRLVVDDSISKNKLMELALRMDADLLKMISQHQRLKHHFFVKIDDLLVFDKQKFIQFISNKEFLRDSYTAFKNKIGLSQNNEKLLKEFNDVVLSWPYKDCVLTGGQDKEDAKQNEVFYNETLAPDEIDRLFDPKVFTNWKRYDQYGVHVNPNFNHDDNFIFRGNNLLVLHSLKQKFQGKVKLIYIDPPYNTKNDSFKYNDRFSHSTWLTFMKNRLEVAKELLSNDGAIFVQIDYIEEAYLKVLMDETFGRNNFVQKITVKTATASGFKVVNPGPVNVTETILMYTKSKRDFNHKKVYVKGDYIKDYKYVIENPEETPEKWEIAKIKDKVMENLEDETIQALKKVNDKEIKNTMIQHFIAKYAEENAERVFATYSPHKPSEKLKKLINKSKHDPDQIIHAKREDNRDFYLLNGRLLAFYDKKLNKVDGKQVPTQLLTDLWDDISWDALSFEGGVTLKNGKKPEKLLKRVIELATEPGDLVLDFFLGSGTTAAVAHKMERQYIGVEQLDYGDDDSVVRLQRVIQGEQSGVSQMIDWHGGGSFVYAELFEWNNKFLQRIQTAKHTEELINVWNDMKKHAFLHYLVDEASFESNIYQFKRLSLEDQKTFLCECLDKNHLYVNYSEMLDSEYKVEQSVQKMNESFYQGDPYD